MHPPPASDPGPSALIRHGREEDHGACGPTGARGDGGGGRGHASRRGRRRCRPGSGERRPGRGTRRIRGGDGVAGSPNRALVIVLAVVAVVAVAAGVIAANRPVTEYDRGTPEGVVQAYLAAVVDGDHDEAARFLSEESPCSAVDLDRAHLPDGLRVVLREAEVEADSARVEVDVAQSSGGLFDGSEHTEKHSFRLSRASGTWLVTGRPWPMVECGEGA